MEDECPNRDKILPDITGLVNHIKAAHKLKSAIPTDGIIDIVANCEADLIKEKDADGRQSFKTILLQKTTVRQFSQSILRTKNKKYQNRIKL